MPQLPQFIATGPQQPAPRVFANPEEASVTGAAGARAGNEVFGAADQFVQRYANAKRQAIAADAVAAASKQLGDLEFTQSKIPDRDKAYSGYLQGAGLSVDGNGQIQLGSGGIIGNVLDGISDPLAKQYAQGEIVKEGIARGLATQGAAFALESSAHKGALDAQLFQYANEASAASTPQLRAILTDNANAAIAGAVAGGWLHPEEGTQRQIVFRSQLAATDADSYIRNAAQQAAAGRLTPIDIANTISDPKNFVGMTIEQRNQKADEGLRLGRTIVAMQTASQAHADSVADRALKAAQAANAADLIAKITSAKPGQAAAVDPGALAGLVKNQVISEAGFSAALAAQTRAAAGHDDPATAMDLYRRFGNGEDVSHDALAAYSQGNLKLETMLAFGKGQAERDKGGDSAVDKQNFATLKTALNGYAIEQGLFAGQDRQEKAQLWTNAQAEWTQRVTIGHEKSPDVLGDMLQRYVKAPGSPEGLPAPRLGAVRSSADVAAIAQKTEQAYQAKQLTPAAYEAEKALLVQYNRMFAAQEAAAAAAKAAKAGGKPAAGNSSAPSADMNP